MAGRIIRLLERTAFDYSSLPISTATGDISLGDVDVSGSRETTLLIRVHSLSLLASGTPKYVISVKAAAPTSEDPAQFFRDPTALVSTNVTTAAGTVPYMLRAAVPANCGAWITVFLTATQGTSVANLMATLSIDVSLKE